MIINKNRYPLNFLISNTNQLIVIDYYWLLLILLIIDYDWLISPGWFQIKFFDKF